MKLSSGTVHIIPKDWQDTLVKRSDLSALWEDITPLARNEWICWIEDAKKPETRARRITVGIDKLNKGMRRPCCWAGCVHREKSGA